MTGSRISDSRVIYSKNWKAALHSIFFFLILLFLPALTIWLTLNAVNDSMSKKIKQQSLDEMAEITAHMARLADPETYYYETLGRLADSFRWASSTRDILHPEPDILELFLFNSTGSRLLWPNKMISKRKISEDYMQILIQLQKSNSTLSRKEQSIVTRFSGNRTTAHSLVKSPETLINFYGIGLKKYGALFKVLLPGALDNGYLLGWLNPDKINRHKLVQSTIEKMQRMAGSKYKFSWIDLGNKKLNKTTGKSRLTEKGLKILTIEGLKSDFRIDNELFSIADTPDGIRLITSRKVPEPAPILEYYYRLLMIVIPLLILFMLWKKIFKVNLNLSATTQFTAIFGLISMTGISILVISTIAYQYEKQNSLLADHREKAIEILEKIDHNYIVSYSDLLKQYRHLIELLKSSSKPVSEILEPLQIAQLEDRIDFASYSDANGNFIFKAPSKTIPGESSSVESKYSSLIRQLTSQAIRSFNSSRMPRNESKESNIGIEILTSKPTEVFLLNRSTLQNISFDGYETLTFMDLVIDKHDIASECLFIIHDRLKMELNYLALAASKLTGIYNYELVAFPKKNIDRNAYFPRYSLSKEPPLWKLQNQVNQNQVSCFKQEKINGQQVLITAIPGHNISSYNLFLITPLNPILSEVHKISWIFIIGPLIVLLFISILSVILVHTLIRPISIMAQNASLLTHENFAKNASSNTIDSALEGELESIFTGLTDLILKVREFNLGYSIKRHLLPPKTAKFGFYILDGFQIGKSKEEREIYHFARLDDNTSLVFMMHTDLEGIEASLTLSMARMAVRLISSELNVQSAFYILKNLEEYFRINLRKRLSGDFFAATINHAENKISFCNSGKIKMIISDLNTCEIEQQKLPDHKIGSTEFYRAENQEISILPNKIVIIMSPVFAESCLQKLPAIISLVAIKKENESTLSIFKQGIEQICNDEFYETASLLIVEKQASGEEKA